MARWIGIDYGRKRIGVAATDPLGLIATPLKTFASNEIIPFLQDYISHEEIKGIVIGMPMTLENQPCALTPLVKQFTRLLHRYFPTLPLYHHDERFTSSMAKASLLESGISKKKRRDKARLDAISASFILMSFMELHARGQASPVNS